MVFIGKEFINGISSTSGILGLAKWEIILAKMKSYNERLSVSIRTIQSQ